VTQYHFLDESGDPGLDGSASSSSHFALAMVQLTERAPLPDLARTRQRLHLPPDFEFKYHKTTLQQKTIFFRSIRSLPFRVRAVVIEKSGLPERFATLSGQDLTVAFIVELTLRASPLDIADDVLVIDAAKRAFLWKLRVRLSQECRRLKRVRSFRTIVGGDSSRDDGLQLADMVVGATRQHIMGIESRYYQTFADKMIDLWEVGAKRQ
jgi:hypothetical protein